MPRPTSQRGLAGATVIIIIILGVLAALLGRTLFTDERGLGQREATAASLRRVSEALAAYASLNRRLPCPAAGTDDAGQEDASGGIVNCASADGVVPWASLALRRGDAIDGWGRKISYRVFFGAAGLTRVGGINMTDCNTSATATAAAVATCAPGPGHSTHPADFLLGKGLSIQADAGTTTGHAFVLVSHGETGAGAFGAQGTDRSPLPAAGSLERPNTQGASPYNNRSRSAPGVATTDAAYFDDMVVSMPIAELAGLAKLSARDWGPPVIASQNFAAADLATVLGYTPDPATNANTNQDDLDFGAIRVRGFAGGANQNISFGQGVSGTGIGATIAGETSNALATISASNNESLRFRFDTPARYLAITLVDFGTQSGDVEQLQFWFKVGAIVIPVTVEACRAGDVLANYSLTPGGDFDEVYVAALGTKGGVTHSQFLVKAIATCNAAGCRVPGSSPADNCPSP